MTLSKILLHPKKNKKRFDHDPQKLDHISRTYNQIQEYLICKINDNSYHDGTSALFDMFFEKEPHLNAVEIIYIFLKKFFCFLKDIFKASPSCLNKNRLIVNCFGLCWYLSKKFNWYLPYL